MNDAQDLKQQCRDLQSRLSLLRTTDQLRLKPGLRSAFSALEAGSGKAGAQIEALTLQMAQAMERSLVPIAEKLPLNFPEDLPISAHAESIREKIRNNPVVIVCGSTGSGKTTQLPKLALGAGCGRNGRIGCTQPRRIAATSLARRVAGELGVEPGNEVGCKVRFDDRTTEKTVVKFMTDGILLAETRSDPMLYQYDCIILDEVHERSLNIDFLLGYLKLLLQKRKDLKVILSSATLEAERLAAFFGGAATEEVEGRLFPIEDCWIEPREEEDLTDTVARGVDFLNELDPRGDILIFLPGEREIRDCAETLSGRRFPNTEILPLFGHLSSGDQQKVFSPSRFRRIVLATNVAETSLTIPGIRYVVDSGLVRLSRYNPRSGIQELRVEQISKASARQRRGRCGRLRDGICVHLYSEETLQESADFTPPEIQRSSLAGVILQMASLNLPPLGEFPLVDEPAPTLIREGMRTLNDLRALDGTRLTRLGRALAALPLDPRLGKMLLDGHRVRLLPELLVIVAFLSIPDPRERPFEKAAEADAAHRAFASEESDYLGILKLWTALDAEFHLKNSNQALKRFALKNFLNYRRVREWRNLVDDLTELMKENRRICPEKKIDPERISYDLLHKVLLGALPRQLGAYNRETRLYSDRAGKKYLIFPGSGLARRKNPPDFMLSFHLVETSRVFARCNAAVRAEWLEEVAPFLCSRVYDSVYWDENSGFVYARERVTAGQLVIHPGRRCLYSRTHPAEAREVFLREALVTGKATLRGTWLEKHSCRIRELHQLERKIRRPDSLVDDEALFACFDQHLPPDISSVDAVRKEWERSHKSYLPPEEAFLTEEYAAIDRRDYPAFLTFSGQRFALTYRYMPGEEFDGVTLTVPEDSLNLLNAHVLDYLVPGYLGEKVEMLLRALPKRLRVELTPVGDVADAFMKQYREGAVFTEQPLAEALAEFVRTERGVEIDPEAFESVDLPEYLKMKLAVRAENGKIREIRRTFPEIHRLNSALSTSIPAVRKWEVKNALDWPGDGEELPEIITVSKEAETLGYPALTAEENSIGRKVYLKEEEAHAMQERGILKLCRLRMPQFVKTLRNMIRIPHDMELSFFLEDRSWKDDLVDSALLDSFPSDTWHIRSAAAFDAALEQARDRAAGNLENELKNLHQIYHLYRETENFVDRLPEESDAACAIRDRFDLLFRNGFLRCRSAFSRYERYWKALKIRAERAVISPAKDAQKGADLLPFISRLRLALGQTADLERNTSLRDFYLLYEEANINRFAPEIKTLEKCGPEILKKRWENVRL